jgi:hypothetical protein
MDLLKRGIQSYAWLVGGAIVLALVWGTNLLVLHNTTAEIGWPVLVGVTVVVMLLGGGLHYLDTKSKADTHHGHTAVTRLWNSRE